LALRSLAGVAVTAQHLQVVRLVGAASRYWVDVVYLKRGAILGGNAAHLAAVAIALQYFKSQARLDCLAL
jgi:cell division protein FtsX